MKKILVLIVVLGFASLGWPEVQKADDRVEIEKAIDAVYPALVRIHVVYPGYYEGREIRGEAV